MPGFNKYLRQCAVNYLFIVTYLAKIKIRDPLIYHIINFIIPELEKY